MLINGKTLEEIKAEYEKAESVGLKCEQEIALVEALMATERNADRYQWLRSRHWNDSDLCVVLDPKRAVKLGYICPSEERLDFAIDAAIEAEKKRLKTASRCEPAHRRN